MSPFFTSPQRDGGYDVADYCGVDPRFGTLDDFDDLLAEAHRLGLRVIIDLVPNHTSSEHEWFTAAVAAGPGSLERSRYLFRDGKGANGELPPNNWLSVFGGSAWERLTTPDGVPEQWYLHLFDVSQPDLDWTSEWVREQFRDILRFWLRRGVDGFRVDVAHGLIKKAGLPDYTPPPADDSASMTAPGDVPYWAQPGVHEIYRDWRTVLLEFGPDRILCAEAWVEPLSKLADWVRPRRDAAGVQLHVPRGAVVGVRDQDRDHLIHRGIRAGGRGSRPGCSRTTTCCGTPAASGSNRHRRRVSAWARRPSRSRTPSSASTAPARRR